MFSHMSCVGTRHVQALRPGGVIVVKDNSLETDKPLGFWIDSDDGYFIRSQEYQEKVFQLAGMRVLRKAQVSPVPTWACLQ